jgi:alginate O-acetyltransferase complex protein AlgI
MTGLSGRFCFVYICKKKENKMVFTSPVFLFLFLPFFLAVYYMSPARWRSAVILAGSSVFYGWWRMDFLALLYGIIGWNWLVAIGIELWRGQPRAKMLLQGGIAVNLLALGYFKYWNFGVNSLFAILVKAGIHPPTGLIEVLLPIGISFFVFHGISYIVDVWRQDTPATRNFFDFAAFITLFPHLIAGPVLRYKDLAWQFKNRHHGPDIFSEGAYRFMLGFSKKVLIADTVAPLSDAAFALTDPSMADAWLGCVAYTIQLYFDFAGYSEMAVGLALMMGFRFIENFNYPYISRSITEFWRRWHISLSTWLRDYLYIPLGGNRKGNVRTYINLMLTMLLGGLWHGANWTFIIWGGWHGMLLAIERLLKIGPETPASIPARIFPTAATLLAIMLGWVMFRAPHVETAIAFYKAMAGFNGLPVSADLRWQIKGMGLCALVVGIIVVFAQPYFARYREPVMLSKESVAVKSAMPLPMQVGAVSFFLLAVTRLLAMNYSPFLYFQF